MELMHIQRAVMDELVVVLKQAQQQTARALDQTERAIEQSHNAIRCIDDVHLFYEETAGVA